MNFLRVLCACSCLTFFASALVAADDIRFSKSLAPAELTAVGLPQLTSDQVAILDALARRDSDVSARLIRLGQPRAPRFSSRLTGDERRNAGLTQLTEAQLLRLDELVARLIEPAAPASGTATATSSPNNAVLTSTSLRRAPEIHGAISLMYGQGSGGYSERGGAIVLSYEDPSGVALALGYSEVRTKGGYGYYPYDYSDRLRRGYSRLGGLDALDGLDRSRW